MGRGKSKAGGGSSRASGGGGVTAKVEQTFYDLPKNAKRTEIKTMVDGAPNGTTIAMKEGATTVIYQKVGENPIRSVWMRTTSTGGGEDMASNYDNGYIVSDIQRMVKSKNVVKGLTTEQKKKSKSHFNSIKGHFNIK